MKRERGATLLEAALILPLLVALFLGVVEFGFAWRDVNAIERGLQTAARVGASASSTRYADYNTLRALDSSLGDLAGATVQRVVIFRSTSADGVVPSGCAGGTAVSGVCNVYTAAQLDTENPTGFPDTGAGCVGAWDASWCPMSRDDDLPTPDYLGVWVRLSYDRFTSVIPTPTVTIERTAVFQVEPCVPGGGRPCS